MYKKSFGCALVYTTPEERLRNARDHRISVSVFDTTGNFAHQAQTFLDAAIPLVAKIGYRFVVYILEHKIRTAIRGYPTVQQRNDEGVSESRQNLSLLPETQRRFGANEPFAEQLQSNLLPEWSPLPLGRVDLTHAPFRNQAHKPVGANQLPCEIALPGIGAQQKLFDLKRDRGFVGAQHGVEFAHERRIIPEDAG
jgi:hypothetical protein